MNDSMAELRSALADLAGDYAAAAPMPLRIRGEVRRRRGWQRVRVAGPIVAMVAAITVMPYALRDRSDGSAPVAAIPPVGSTSSPLAIGSAPGAASDQPQPAVAEGYVYPVVPGTPAWAKLKTGADMRRATQIPPSVLASMSTAGLIDTVLRYPLAGDLEAFSSLQQGFDQVASRFNGLAALLTRHDAIDGLLKRYQAMDPARLPAAAPDLERGRYAASFTFIEMILAQKQMWSGAATDKRAVLLATAKQKLAAKKLSGYFGRSGQQPTELIIERLLANA